MSLRSLNIFLQSRRSFSTSQISNGKKNFRKFTWINRGTDQFHEEMKTNPDPRFIPDYGVREVLFNPNGTPIVETIPEIVVPNLEGFKLKPYVSYRTNDVNSREYTAKDLFYDIYGEKIRKDFIEGKLDEDGNPLTPSEYESITSEQAQLRAQQTGSDLFVEDVDVGDREPITKDYYL